MNTTKENILNTSLALFAQRGFSSVSVRDIAGELGITQSALYKHYASKQDIFDQIVKRMEETDYERSKDASVPGEALNSSDDKASGVDAGKNFGSYNSDTVDAYARTSIDAYANTSIEDMKQFTVAQFRYWTEDVFAANFRRMLTLEQYRSPEASVLYNQYLSAGIIDYITDLFANMKGVKNEVRNSPRDYALRFYGPVFMALSLYDSADTPNSKEQIMQMVEAHVMDFAL